MRRIRINYKIFLKPQALLCLLFSLVFYVELRSLECDEVRWVGLKDLDEFTFPEANAPIITALQQQIG